MLIVADENIPLLDPFFDDIGEIRRVSARQMTASDVTDADILLVRSVTRVDERLLAGSRVKFVGTATIGTDHVDQAWLQSQKIGFASAPGCNATSVVEYVLSVINLFAERRGLDDWTSLTVGIVGAGNVGSALDRCLTRLGFQTRVCDPPRADAEASGEQAFVSLDEALGCDVVTLHTPLTESGRHPTRYLLGAEKLGSLSSGQLLINSSRGEVVDGAALLTRLSRPDAPLVVLDVWEHEPQISVELAKQVWLATPHIAGYSLEGKVQGTEMIYQALCRFLGLPTRKSSGQFLPQPALSKLGFSRTARSEEAAATAIRACYDPRRDDARLRQTLTLPDSNERRLAFDDLRRNYPVRREFSSVKVQLKGGNRSLQDVFRSLGFRLKL